MCVEDEGKVRTHGILEHGCGRSGVRWRWMAGGGGGGVGEVGGCVETIGVSGVKR